MHDNPQALLSTSTPKKVLLIGIAVAGILLFIGQSYWVPPTVNFILRAQQATFDYKSFMPGKVMVGDCGSSDSEYLFNADGTVKKATKFLLADIEIASSTEYWKMHGDILYIGTTTDNVQKFETLFPIQIKGKKLLIADSLFFQTGCGYVVADSLNTIDTYQKNLGTTYKNLKI